MKKRKWLFLNLILVSLLLICVTCTEKKKEKKIRSLKSIQLPRPFFENNVRLIQALRKRKSARLFSPKKLSIQMLSNLLWAACGVNRPDSGGRTSPSAYNTHAVEVYVASESGLYLYDAENSKLKMLSAEDIRSLTGKQAYVNSAAINLVYVADFSRLKKARRKNKLLYAAAGAGFISQNVYLYCASEGLATVVRGYIDKKALARELNLRKGQMILLAQSVGYPQQSMKENEN